MEWKAVLCSAIALAAMPDVCMGFQISSAVRSRDMLGRLGAQSERGSRVCTLQGTAVATGGGGDSGKDEPELERAWPAKSERSMDYSLMKGEVAVRFINAPGRFPSTGKNDLVAAAKPGDILIQVGDSVGIELPRGCMTGLCGACTCDLEDPSFPGSRSVLRACSTRVVVPEGCTEMVIDVYRMQETKSKPKQDPMARFSQLDDPNVGFKARWNMPEKGAAAKASCAACGASNVNPKGAMPEDCVLAKGCPFGKL